MTVVLHLPQDAIIEVRDGVMTVHEDIDNKVVTDYSALLGL